MIASILNIIPLIGRQATKAEVMKQMSSVGLIHIAAHGNALTGETALSPNPGWTSKFPQEEDFILKMSDVQAGELENEYPSFRKVGNRSLPPSNSDNPFKPFYGAVISPIIDMLGPQDDELVIVPDGVLCLTPWAAVI